MKLCFLDTETTGLDPSKHRVIELATVILSPWPAMETLLDFSTKIKLSEADEAAASPEALAVNGYSRDKWAAAVDSNIGFWARVHGALQGVTLVCQNYPFDSGFVTAELGRYHLRPSWDRRYIELYSYMALLSEEFDVRDSRGKRTWNLQSVYRAMGLREPGFPELPEHEAHPDVQRMIAIYRYVCERWNRG